MSPSDTHQGALEERIADLELMLVDLKAKETAALCSVTEHQLSLDALRFKRSAAAGYLLELGKLMGELRVVERAKLSQEDQRAIVEAMRALTVALLPPGTPVPPMVSSVGRLAPRAAPVLQLVRDGEPPRSA